MLDLIADLVNNAYYHNITFFNHETAKKLQKNCKIKARLSQANDFVNLIVNFNNNFLSQRSSGPHPVPLAFPHKMSKRPGSGRWNGKGKLFHRLQYESYNLHIS